jgi:hypothetical protein
MRFKTVDGMMYKTSATMKQIVENEWIKAQTEAYYIKVYVNTKTIVHMEIE